MNKVLDKDWFEFDVGFDVVDIGFNVNIVCFGFRGVHNVGFELDVHVVGLDVHDVGSKVSYKSERILEEGNFITVEPGIYFIDFVLEKAFKDPEQSKYLNEEILRT